MNIWIINEYAGSPYHGMTYRHYYMARELIKHGYKVTIFASSFSHYKLSQHITTNKTFTQELIDGVNFVWVKMPQYKAPKSFGRVRNWFLFALKLFFIPFLKLEKPDYILVSSLPLHPILPGKYLAAKYNAKFIFEVRDIWPLSAIEIGGYSPKNPFIKHLQWLEDFAYKQSDEVVTVLANAYEHMRTRGLAESKFNYIPNGISIDEMAQKEPLDDFIKEQVPKNKFIVGYAGTFGVANSLDSFIEAAKLLQEHDDIVFLLVGDGKEKTKLLSKSRELKNVVFIGSISKKQVQSMLCLFDICFIGLKNDPLFKYGVSPNKLFDYFYSGKPIVYAINSGIFQPVAETNSGITVKAEDALDIASGILYLKSLNKEDRDKLGQNGKTYVLENHTYEKLAKKLIQVFEK